MEQSELVRLAVMRDAPTKSRREVSAINMEQSVQQKHAAMREPGKKGGICR